MVEQAVGQVIDFVEVFPVRGDAMPMLTAYEVRVGGQEPYAGRRRAGRSLLSRRFDNDLRVTEKKRSQLTGWQKGSRVEG